MMNEEIPTFISNADPDALGGQTMYIHLPEGAVIVDRSQTVVQSPVSPPKSAESIPLQSEPGQPFPAQSIPMQPGIQFIQPQPGVSHVNPQPGVSYVNPQPGFTYVQAQPGVTYLQAQPGVTYSQSQLGASYAQGQQSRNYGRRRRYRDDEIVLRRRYRTDWVHSMTVVFAAYVILVTLVPFMLVGFFGIGLYASKTNNAELTIARGELIVSHLTPVARLIPGELVLLREMNTWNLQVRQVGSTSTTGLVTTISTNTGLNSTSSEVMKMDSNTNVRNITSAIPIFGYFVMFFSSALGKVLGAGIILYLNYRHLIRKRRARLIDEKVAYVVDRPLS